MTWVRLHPIILNKQEKLVSLYPFQRAAVSPDAQLGLRETGWCRLMTRAGAFRKAGGAF